MDSKSILQSAYTKLAVGMSNATDAASGVAVASGNTVFNTLVAMSVGGYPTDVSVVDLTRVHYRDAYVPYLRSVAVTVVDLKSNEKKDYIQGKAITEQPYGPNGHASGRLNITLEQFVDPGFVTILWPPGINAVISYGLNVVYGAEKTTHWGVRVSTSQLSKVVLSVPKAASAVFTFKYDTGNIGGNVAATASSVSQKLGDVDVFSVSSAYVDSYKALATLVRPFAVTFERENQGVAVVVFSQCRGVYGGMCVDAREHDVCVVGPTSGSSIVYVDGHDASVFALVRSGQEWNRVAVLSRRPVVQAML